MGTLSKSLAVLLVLTAASAIILIGSSTVPILPKGSQVWSETFGGAGDEWAFSVIQTSDGGYAIAGYTDSFGVGNMDFWLVKTDSFGNQEWNKTYGGAGYDWASSLVQTSDGGYVIAGSTNSSGEWGYDFWLVKTDSSGNQQWNKTYGGTNHDYASSVVQTIDGGYALAGIANSFGDGGYAFSGFRDVFIVGNADAWLVKTDSSGNELWNKTFGEFHDDGAFSVIQTSDGGYALAGITNSSGAGFEDVWLIKTDASGNVIWNKTYGGTLNDEAYFVMQTKDEGYALAGATYALNAGLWDAWLIKTDFSGNILWTQVHGGVGDDQAISLVLTGEGEFVLTGSTNTFGAGGWDAWLFKVMGTDVSSANQSPTQNPS